MPTIVHSRLDYATPWRLPDIYLFTGNPIRRSDGALVMGRGAARQVRDHWPTVQHHIRTDKPVTFYPIHDEQWIGWFQVKHHWRDPADLALIRRSSEALASIARRRQGRRFHLNAPGIGNGRLQWADVEPLLANLPANVSIYL